MIEVFLSYISTGKLSVILSGILSCKLPCILTATDEGGILMGILTNIYSKLSYSSFIFSDFLDDKYSSFFFFCVFYFFNKSGCKFPFSSTYFLFIFIILKFARKKMISYNLIVYNFK